jgi:hypothetical protein
MVLDGQHPAIIRNAVATPGGCTIGGLLTMEDGKIRSTMVWTPIVKSNHRLELFKKLLMLRVDWEKPRDRYPSINLVYIKPDLSF